MKVVLLRAPFMLLRENYARQVSVRKIEFIIMIINYYCIIKKYTQTVLLIADFPANSKLIFS